MTRTASKLRWLRLEALWPSSLLFSLLLLGGYKVLENPRFALLISIVGLAHLLICIRFAPYPSVRLLLSQSLVALAAVTAVVLHVVHVVGPPPSGLWRMVGSFVAAELAEVSAYLLFGFYIMIFTLAVVGLLVFARGLRLQAGITPGLLVATAYAASAVNLAFDYSLRRPLYRVSGEPDAEAFFFAAGLFGLEFSLALHMILLLVCWATSRLPILSGRERLQQR